LQLPSVHSWSNSAARLRRLLERARKKRSASGAKAPPYEELAAAHAMTVPQLKSFVHRARRRLRELLLARVADTVQTPDEAEAELGDLMRALGA
jgi:DNA-directed RNA polymerase specialized sigma24 family protein